LSCCKFQAISLRHSIKHWSPSTSRRLCYGWLHDSRMNNVTNWKEMSHLHWKKQQKNKNKTESPDIKIFFWLFLKNYTKGSKISNLRRSYHPERYDYDLAKWGSKQALEKRKTSLSLMEVFNIALKCRVFRF
jgi:hypothetical protein